ncbi:Gelsolin, partial [Operophtera brumata]
EQRQEEQALVGHPLLDRQRVYAGRVGRGRYPHALTYLAGGNPSGFNHVVTNAGATKRLIQVKGKRNVRVREVDPQISSMNSGDVFILDKDSDILVLVGEHARNVEKLKAISDAYILDTISGSIYVWIGKRATAAEKAEAMSKAQELFAAKKYPAWFTEPAIFKQYFTTWRDVGMSHSRLV